jgi:hypothetical protein
MWKVTINVILMGLLLLLFMVLGGSCLWKYAILDLQVAFADEQTDIFEDMRVQALHAKPEKAVEYLAYVVWYYPSGTKQGRVQS